MIRRDGGPCEPIRHEGSARTEFDTPGRSSPRDIAAAGAVVQSNTGLMSVLDGMPQPTFLLNVHRQVVVANAAGVSLVQQFGRSRPEGFRLGEGLACVNVAKGPEGCGTSAQCRYCGLGIANRKFGARPDTYEMEVHLRSVRGAMEVACTFQAHLAPVEVTGSVFRLCSLHDITAIRSREALEQIFFHDVLNTAQAVQGAATLIPGLDDPGTLDQLAHIVSVSATTLVDEIETQRDLLLADDDALAVSLTPDHVWHVVADAVELYRHSRFGQGRAIDLQPLTGNDLIETSRVHLSRSVGNLLKNALEASAPGQRVSVGVVGGQDEVAILVQNAAVMPESVQAQVFQRFFSTKARSGRGLGTYSVRLLVSRYLNGSVGFTSNAAEGTTFTIRLSRGGATAH